MIWDKLFLITDAPCARVPPFDIENYKRECIIQTFDYNGISEYFIIRIFAINIDIFPYIEFSTRFSWFARKNLLKYEMQNFTKKKKNTDGIYKIVMFKSTCRL